MKTVSELIKLSKYAGERFDLVQAGGGNVSVKDEVGNMYIKASGITLSEMDEKNGYVKLNNRILLKFFNNLNDNITENEANKILNKAKEENSQKSSIETFMHSFLGKYVLHTHPIAVNVIMAEKNWDKIIKSLFPNSISIPYKKPGFYLAKEIYKALKENKRQVIFLQNHGLIVFAENYKEIIKITDEVVLKIEKYLNMDLSRYKLTNQISSLINRFEKNNIAYLSENMIVNKFLQAHRNYFFTKPFCPDALVYNGITALELSDDKRLKQIEDFIKIYREIPKVVLYRGFVFLIAKDILKAKKMEEMLVFHLLSLSKIKDVNTLSDKDMEELKNWDAEKYRKNI